MNPKNKKGNAMEIKYVTYSEEDMIGNLNIAKDEFVNFLLNKKFITHEQAVDLWKNYHVSIMKRSFFSRWWKKYFPENKDNNIIVITKQMNIEDPEEIKGNEDKSV